MALKIAETGPFDNVGDEDLLHSILAGKHFTGPSRKEDLREALYIVAYAGQAGFVDALLKAGATDGRLPPHFPKAFNRGGWRVGNSAELVLHSAPGREVTAALLTAGLYDERELHQAICHAAAAGDEDKLDVLLTSGIELPFDALMVAAQHGQTGMMRFHLQIVNPGLDWGKLLQYAAQKNQLAIVEVLLEAGADVHLPGNFHLAPESWVTVYQQAQRGDFQTDINDAISARG
ncbi:hypothetical protein HDV00_011597 [Rhizophlyctis rosea]|nr:hypothetical protein HDV00_011597 [Rhizophlyctis rosea]